MSTAPAGGAPAADVTAAPIPAPGFVRSAAVVATSTDEDHRVDIRSGHHRLAADEPASNGGADTATTPVGLLLSALGSCTAITLRMYAQRKQWPLRTVRVHLGYEKGPDRAVRITRRIELLGDLDEAQRARLLDIAERTPVTRAVAGGTPIIAAGPALPTTPPAPRAPSAEPTAAPTAAPTAEESPTHA
ncbi:OsmC family protein [Kitasatospora sp. NBC_01287]|uniref:OsmC family protein n=1 Tax=Kitasatospora sp. NBC_01287 TaxID=2903573 RepID=UPI0022587F79|nr:OsmC family protein [Kitasatospora sp. NBC_01287]MCX4751142.1 OsmC family protein [Kitasatospora sp. NBC_01287]